MTLRRMGERLMEQVAVTEARKTELDAATTTVPNALAALAKSMRATWRDAADTAAKALLKAWKQMEDALE
jgi:hypothetical protein